MNRRGFFTLLAGTLLAAKTVKGKPKVYQGQIENVRIHSSALTLVEIQEGFHAVSSREIERLFKNLAQTSRAY